MKRFALAVLCLALGVSHATAADRKTAWEEDDLEGKVRSVRAETTTIGKPAERSTRVTRYDNQGRRLEWSRNDANGKLKDRTSYTYTAKSGVADLLYFGPKNTLLTKSVFGYDSKGHRTEISNYDAKGTLKDKTISIYDAHGDETEASRTDPDGAIIERVVYTFDAKGRVGELSRYDGTGALTSKVVNSYDDHGHLAVQTTYDGVGAMTSKETWTNDDDGNKVDWVIYNADASVKEKWQYDYKFDKAGNWTKRTASKVVEKFGKPTTVPTYVTTRTIEYF